MAVFINTFFEERVQQLFSLAETVEKIFASAGLEYRVVGGLATYLYVEQAEPDAGRLTRDIDIAIRCEDLEKIAAAAAPFGFQLRHVAGADMLVRTEEPSARRAVRLIFAGEKVRPEYPEPVPPIGPAQGIRGFRVALVADLVRVKITSFRAKDETHLKDLDEAGLITPEIESGLSSILRERLDRMRARD